MDVKYDQLSGPNDSGGLRWEMTARLCEGHTVAAIREYGMIQRVKEAPPVTVSFQPGWKRM